MFNIDKQQHCGEKFLHVGRWPLKEKGRLKMTLMEVKKIDP